MSEAWIRVAFGRSREVAMDRFVTWRHCSRRDLSDDDTRVYWGTHADGGDYWEVWVREQESDG
jgi:hypothetical protein